MGSNHGLAATHRLWCSMFLVKICIQCNNVFYFWFLGKTLIWINILPPWSYHWTWVVSKEKFCCIKFCNLKLLQQMGIRQHAASFLNETCCCLTWNGVDDNIFFLLVCLLSHWQCWLIVWDQFPVEGNRLFVDESRPIDQCLSLLSLSSSFYESFPGFLHFEN